MRRSFGNVLVLFCCAAWGTGFAAERDEDLAFSFVYCAEMTALFLEELPDVAAARGGVDEMRRSYALFYEAAEIVSDAQFLEGLDMEAQTMVFGELEKGQDSDAELLAGAEDCARWFTERAVPILGQAKSR